jgi:hypothetical protein
MKNTKVGKSEKAMAGVRLVLWAGFAFIVCSSLYMSWAVGESQESVAEPVKADEEINLQAMGILEEMAKTIAAAEQFGVTIRSSYDAPQDNGEMVEFGALRTLQVKRPNLLRVDVHRSDGDRRLVLFDDERIIVHNVTDNVYAKVEHASNIDEKIKYLVRDLQIPLPLARMFRTSFPGEIVKLVEAIDYVERDMLADVPTGHLAIRTRDVDVQIWITEGESPLPRRIVITYKHVQGRPQFRANFYGWDLSGKAGSGPFNFTVPEDCEQIPILTAVSMKANIPVPTGGVK